MRLKNAARHFDRMSCTDAYTGAFLFMGQLDLYDGNKRDSETAERRVISTAAGTTLPARRVVACAGLHFILGHVYPDSFYGENIRQGITCHEATGQAIIRTLDQVCRGQSGTSAWAGRAWVKNLAYSEQDSKLSGEHHIHLAATESLSAGQTVLFENRLHVVRAVTNGPAGTLVALCDELFEPAIEIASVLTGSYDPVVETTTGTSTVVTFVRVRWQSLFEYRHNLAPKFGAGEIQLVASKAVVTMKAGLTVTLSDGTWIIKSALDEGDVWLCHAARHG